MMLNFIIPPQIAETSYYMERISIKLANLFGVFADILLFLFIVILFCSLLLWIMLPIIEFRKKTLLNKIHAQLVDNYEELRSINRCLSDLTATTEETKD